MGPDLSFYYSAPKGGMLWVFSVDGVLADNGAPNQIEIDTALPVFSK